MVEYKIVLPKRNLRLVAPWQKRLLAFLVDVLIFFFVIATPFFSIYYSVAGLPLDKVSTEDVMANGSLLTIVLVGDYAAQFLFLLYLAGAEYLFGATLGKKLLNLSVVSEKEFGKVSLIGAVIRNLSKSVFFPVIAFDAAPMLFDERRRKLSDFVSNTLVVENRKLIKRFPAVDMS